MQPLFYKLPRSIAKIFSGTNLLWHALAIFLTFIIVTSGFDWRYFTATRNATLQLVIFPAIILGGLLPILVPLLLLLIGKMKKDARTVNTAWALGQAAIAGALVSGFYKAFTGRIPPEFLHGTALTDISHGFRFGLLRGGVFWGWPSSHTTVAFAVSITLLYLYPKNKLIKVLALLYASYIGFGISVSIHWLSEFVAGAIIGTIVGTVIGKVFSGRYTSTPGGDIKAYALGNSFLAMEKIPKAIKGAAKTSIE